MNAVRDGVQRARRIRLGDTPSGFDLLTDPYQSIALLYAGATPTTTQGQAVPAGPTDPNLENLPYNPFYVFTGLSPEQAAYVTAQSATVNSPALNTPANVTQLNADTSAYLATPQPDTLAAGWDDLFGGGGGGGGGSTIPSWVYVAGGLLTFAIALSLAKK